MSTPLRVTVKVNGVELPGLPSAFVASLAATENDATNCAPDSPRTANRGSKPGVNGGGTTSFNVPVPKLSACADAEMPSAPAD